MIRFIFNLKNYNPKNEYSKFIKSYYVDIVKNGTKKYISNIDVKIKIIEINNILIPISFGNNYNNQCFSSSIKGMFDYLLLENKKTKSFVIRFLIHIFGKIILFGIDFSGIYKTIFVNNILLSTNIYPNLNKNDFLEIINFLKQKYKDRSIIFRSINETNISHISNLEFLGCKGILFRQIFLSYKSKVKIYDKIKEVKNDKKLYEKSNYKLIQLKNNISDNIILSEVKACYDYLYLKKYSLMNPNITIDFLKNISKNPYFKINILIGEKGEINGAYCYYEIENQVTAPIFGYQKENLYRHITNCYTHNALKKNDILNWSSGVGQFKQNRGGEKTTEYFYIYYKNLSLIKRITWNIIYFFSKYIGEKYFKNNII